MKRPDGLTPNVLKHLLNFAKSRGLFWRRKLRDYWYTGVTSGFLDEDEASALQAARNSVADKVTHLTVGRMEAWLEEDRYRIAAEDLFHREGQCEIDEGAKVSLGDDEGAYVQAWVWVPASALEAP